MGALASTDLRFHLPSAVRKIMDVLFILQVPTQVLSTWRQLPTLRHSANYKPSQQPLEDGGTRGRSKGVKSKSDYLEVDQHNYESLKSHFDCFSLDIQKTGFLFSKYSPFLRVFVHKISTLYQRSRRAKREGDSARAAGSMKTIEKGEKR